MQVYAEALHYNVTPLVKHLEETPQMFGELVGRQQFLSRVPRYKENIQVLIRVARAEAVAARSSSVLICVLRTEEEERGLCHGAGREAAVTFGPWTAPPSAADLLDCVRMDIQSRGYTVSLEPHPPGGGPFSRSCPCFHTLTFTWW
ncbi:unnamed protein product [Menidia menidia]|uniref:(Atlantic silverside) hypothetical protein n=1 Tax=Menidia menidia TaxID=238744 RepID=A0A8S4BPS6_9TELE|nr:unnamed protein product [Menidia menidia]